MKKQQTEKQITEDIFCLSGLLTTQVNTRVFAEHKLTLSSYMPLQMVKHGIQTITDMRKFSQETAAGLGKKIKHLEDAGLINRILDTHDKRKWLFELTPKGKQACDSAESGFTNLVEQFFIDFSSAEKKTFLQLINKLENNLKQYE